MNFIKLLYFDMYLYICEHNHLLLCIGINWLGLLLNYTRFNLPLHYMQCHYLLMKYIVIKVQYMVLVWVKYVVLVL